MPISQPTFKPEVRIGATDVTITNLSVGTTETSHSLQTGLRKLIIRSRDKAELYISFIVGGTATNFITLKKGCVLEMSDLEFDSKTLYIKADLSNTVEIVETFA